MAHAPGLGKDCFPIGSGVRVSDCCGAGLGLILATEPEEPDERPDQEVEAQNGDVPGDAAEREEGCQTSTADEDHTTDHHHGSEGTENETRSETLETRFDRHLV